MSREQESPANYRVLLLLRAMVVSNAEKAGPDPVKWTLNLGDCLCSDAVHATFR
jgi:hypothetical protein